MVERFESGPVSDERVARNVQISLRDSAILHALVHSVKALSTLQVARTWWRGRHAVTDARKRLVALAQAGLVQPIHFWVGAEITLTGPLATWSPGEPVPDFYALAEVTRRRWDTSVRQTACVVATPLSATRLGGIVRLPRMTEATHDLHVAQVYLIKLANSPRLAQRWEGERTRPDAMPRSGEKVPDAIIRGAGRSIAIEVVGESYTPQKLFAFHEYCAGKAHSYEMW